MRTSGLPPGAAQESMARLRAALTHAGLRPPTQSLTLHVHPPCTKEDVPQLDLAFAAALLALGGRLEAQDLLHTAHAGTLTLSGALHGPHLGPATGLSRRYATPLLRSNVLFTRVEQMHFFPKTTASSTAGKSRTSLSW